MFATTSNLPFSSPPSSILTFLLLAPFAMTTAQRSVVPNIRIHRVPRENSIFLQPSAGCRSPSCAKLQRLKVGAAPYTYASHQASGGKPSNLLIYRQGLKDLSACCWVYVCVTMGPADSVEQTGDYSGVGSCQKLGGGGGGG